MNQYHLALIAACLTSAGTASAKSWHIHVPIAVQSDLYLEGTCYDKFGEQSARALRNTERCDLTLVNGTNRAIKDWALKITWTGADPDGSQEAACESTPYGTRLDAGQEYPLGGNEEVFVWPGTEGQIRARFTRLVFK
jgi:hypothetical protein